MFLAQILLLPPEMRRIFVAAILLSVLRINVSALNWHTFGNHEYALSGTGGNWEDVNAVALSNGGYLSAVESAAEEQFLLNTFAIPMGTPLWIGLTDAIVEGDWRWSNDEPLIYTNWNPGEPNNGGLPNDPTGEEDHAVMYYDKFGWNDWYDLSVRRGNIDPLGIIERPRNPVPESGSPFVMLLAAASSVFFCHRRIRFRA